jgi:4-hydroxy-L-threonine phosphate dehydrogenase PdxA
VIGISMGDPAGIGAEIIVKALADPAIRELARFVIYGRNDILDLAADQAGIAPFWFRVQHDSDRAALPIRENIVVFDFDELDSLRFPPQQPSRDSGYASKTFIEAAITDALRPHAGGTVSEATLRPAPTNTTSCDPRRLDAIVTAPVSKTAWTLAGFKWPGHTELLQKRTNSKRVGMAFVSPRLKVTLATAHIALMDIRNVLTIGRVFDAIDLGHQLCRDLGIARPRIAVCGLNPHAGESGQFGDEEDRLIAPAIKVARESGIDARGPYPGDTIFNAAINSPLPPGEGPGVRASGGGRFTQGSPHPYPLPEGEGTRGPLGTPTTRPTPTSPRFDLVVAMYHDQGLIPVKLLDRDEAVNVTIGLPIIRTSPDHGTAYDIAGKNCANPGSMKAAIRLAAQLAAQKVAAAEQAARSKSEPAA